MKDFDFYCSQLARLCIFLWFSKANFSFKGEYSTPSSVTFLEQILSHRHDGTNCTGLMTTHVNYADDLALTKCFVCTTKVTYTYSYLKCKFFTHLNNIKKIEVFL